jgi:serine/threonine protein kinase
MAAAAPPVWEMHPQYNDHHRPFKNQYELKEELGKGGFGTVRRCIYREAPNAPQREFAAKINNTPEKAREQREERDICARLSEINPAILGTHQFPSPHIVNIFDSLEEGDIVYNIYEIASGGDLSDVLAKKEFFTPLEAADAIRQILWGVNHMHERGYIHRDLKPQNILIQSKNVMVYKVADFGLSRARHLDPGSGMFVKFAHGICGTLQYRPPEGTAQAQTAGSPTRDYDIDFDIWRFVSILMINWIMIKIFLTDSCGVILYQLLAGYPPFWEDSDVETENKIFQRNFEFPDPEW